MGTAQSYELLENPKDKICGYLIAQYTPIPNYVFGQYWTKSIIKKDKKSCYSDSYTSLLEILNMNCVIIKSLDELKLRKKYSLNLDNMIMKDPRSDTAKIFRSYSCPIEFYSESLSQQIPMIDIGLKEFKYEEYLDKIQKEPCKISIYGAEYDLYLMEFLSRLRMTPSNVVFTDNKITLIFTLYNYNVRLLDYKIE
jgi:hypothetical protein